jgi:hypothetical protein
MRRSIAALAAVCALLVTTTASAQEPPPGDHTFGKMNDLAISSDANLSLQVVSVSGGGGSSTLLNIDPAADYFFMDSISVGGQVRLDHDPGGTTIGIGPRVGYNYAFSDLMSIWPKGGLSFDDAHGTAVLGLHLFAPFMFHPARHFFVGIGPNLDTDLTGDVKLTTFGLAFTVGGWMNVAQP